MLRKLTIKGYGTYLPQQTISFGDQIRYRVTPEESQLEMAELACRRALEQAGLDIRDIDCLVSASAVGVQPIPSTAALIHERLAKGTAIPALDINTTCTSFVTALDTMSYLIAAGRYKRVLIVASEVGSRGLNPHQTESYELFSDGAAAFLFEATDEEKGVVASAQATWSEGAHDTEIRGGLTGLPPYDYRPDQKEDFQFDMKGKAILGLVAKKLPRFFKDFFKETGLKPADIDYIIPHQASRALPLIMRKLGFKEEQFLDMVSDYGNMVSVSIPFGLAYALDNGLIKEGDRVALMGTAAGLTTNALLLQL